MIGYVVESQIRDGRTGKIVEGQTARVYTPSEERAQKLVSQAPPDMPRSYRPMPIAEMPEEVRDNMLKALASRS